MGLEWNDVCKIVIDAIDSIVSEDVDLGGMGEYGRGWNDGKAQTRMFAERVKREWERRKTVV